MRAQFTKPVEKATNWDGQKERVDTLRVVALNNEGQIHEFAEARFYMARRSDGASPVYCSVWVHAPGHYLSGSGRASGYGYHKKSAALQEACHSAGIEFFGDNYARTEADSASTKRAYFDGCGDRAMTEALLAVAITAGADPATARIV